MMALEILESMGHGGQGSVFKARGEGGEEVAVKYMKIDDNPTADELQARGKRFAREVDVVRSLDHPGIIKIVDADLEGPQPFFVMPLADRLYPSLAALLAETRPALPIVEDLFAQILTAVAFAHSRDVIHRDIKPDNILLFEGRAVLSDFGLGRDLVESSSITALAAWGGSYPYAAPEQMKQLHTVDKRADVYSLGQVFFELFTRKQAFSYYDLLLIPDRYRSFLERAHETEPNNRFSDADEMFREFEALRVPESMERTHLDLGELIVRVEAGNRSAARSLFDVLEDNADSAELHRVLFRTRRSVLAELNAASALRFSDLVRRSIVLCGKPEDSSEKDNLAFFLHNCIQLVTSTRAAEACATCLLALAGDGAPGYSLDRLRDTIRLAENDQKVLEALEVAWKSHPETVDHLPASLVSKASSRVRIRLEMALAISRR